MIKSTTLFFFGGLLIFVFITSCKKPSNLSSGVTFHETAESTFYNLQGTWIWDSTSLMTLDTLFYTYTPSQLKDYTSKKLTILCNTSSSFSLQFTSDPTEQPRGFNQPFSGEPAKLIFKGEARKDTSILLLNDNWSYFVYSGPRKNEISLYLNGSSYPYHEGSQYIGYLPFAPMNYLIEKSSGGQLFLDVIDPHGYIGKQYKCFFHKVM